jgi:hypothetical protein
VASNPFSTRFIRPGAIPFLFGEGESAARLVERLRQKHWRGQIIGPHGSGKSTLLATLKPELESAGRRVLSITLHQGERRLRALDRRQLDAATQVVIDGYEQLSWWSRSVVKWLCWSSGAGLLATAHTDVELPTIYTTEPSEELVRTVVAQLLSNNGVSMKAADIATAYKLAGGDVRETLFKLFDIYQANEQRVG